jgi:hypothetical protein
MGGRKGVLFSCVLLWLFLLCGLAVNYFAFADFVISL